MPDFPGQRSRTSCQRPIFYECRAVVAWGKRSVVKEQSLKASSPTSVSYDLIHMHSLLLTPPPGLVHLNLSCTATLLEHTFRTGESPELTPGVCFMTVTITIKTTHSPSLHYIDGRPLGQCELRMLSLNHLITSTIHINGSMTTGLAYLVVLETLDFQMT